MLILAELGIDIAPLLASAGIAGVALAFGAQNLVRDFLAGIFMTLEDQYGVGDTVDLGSATGTVVAVSLRTTTVRAATARSGTSATARCSGSATPARVRRWSTIEIPLPVRRRHRRGRRDRAASRQPRSSQSEEFAAAIIEPPKLLGIVDVAPGSGHHRASARPFASSDKDAYLRAVRRAIKSAFDEALADDSAVDFRPPVVTPPGEAG